MKKQFLALALAMNASTAVAVQVPPIQGEFLWEVLTRTDPFTDEKQQTLFSPYGNVFVTCKEITFSFDAPVNEIGKHSKVTIRVDKNEAFTTNGKVSESVRFVSVPIKTIRENNLIEQMKTGKKIIFKATGSRGETELVTEYLGGFTKAFNQLNCSK